MTFSRPTTSTVDALFKPAKQAGELGSGGNLNPGVSQAGRFIDSRDPGDITRNAAIDQRDTQNFIGSLLGLAGVGGGGDGGTNAKGGGIIFDLIDGQASSAFGEFAASGGLDKLRPGDPEQKETYDWLQSQNPLFINRVEGARALGNVESYTKDLATDTAADERLSDPSLTPEQKAQIKAEIQASLREKYLSNIPGKFLAPLVPALTEREATINSNIYSRERSKQLAAARGGESEARQTFLTAFGADIALKQEEDPNYDGTDVLRQALPELFMASSSSSTAEKARVLASEVGSRVEFLTATGKVAEAQALLVAFTKLGEQGGLELNGQNVYNLPLDDSGASFKTKLQGFNAAMGDRFEQKNAENLAFARKDQIVAMVQAGDFDGLAMLWATAKTPRELQEIRNIVNPLLGLVKEQQTDEEQDTLADLRMRLFNKDITKEQAMDEVNNNTSLSGAGKLAAFSLIENANDEDPSAQNFRQVDVAASRNSQAAEKQARIAIESLRGRPGVSNDPKALAALGQQLVGDITYSATQKTAKQAEAGIAKGEIWDAKTYNDAYVKNLGVARDEEVKKFNNDTLTKNKKKEEVEGYLDYVRRAASQGETGVNLFPPQIRRMAKQQGKDNPTGMRSVLEQVMRQTPFWKPGSQAPTSLFGKKDNPAEPDNVRIRNMVEAQIKEGQKARQKQRGGVPPSQGQRPGGWGSTTLPPAVINPSRVSVDSLARNLGLSDNYIATEPNGKAFNGRTQTLYGIKAGTGYRQDHEDHVHHAARDPKEALELAQFLSKKGHRITEFKGWKQAVWGGRDKGSDHYNATAFDIPGGPETHARVLRDINEFYRNRAGVNPGSGARRAINNAGQGLMRFISPAVRGLTPLATALWGTQSGGNRNGGNAPLSAVTPQGVTSWRNLMGRNGTLSASTPALPQAAAAGRTGVLPQALSLNHPIFVAIGINEGTRTASGGFTSAWHGHPDPSGRAGTNRGTVSNNSGKPAAVVDREWTRSLTQTLLRVAPLVGRAAAPGTVGYNRLMFNIADVAVQAPAILNDFIKKIPALARAGFSVDSIAKARADSFRNPATGAWEFSKTAFGNYSGLLADQRRRAYSWEYKRRLGPTSPGKP